MKNNNVKKLVEISLLIALEVILTRFCSINTAILRIGFGFLPIAIIAMMYGPISAGVAYAVGDILGMMIFPSGSYFPGFTLTAFLTGIVYGVVLYDKNDLLERKAKSWVRIILAVCIVCLGINLCLDTLWLYILTGKAYMVLLPPRIIKVAIMIPIQTILIKLVWESVVVKIAKIVTA
ncbi:folate family ECF transporter S component [Intestinibacter sp.]